MGLKSFGLMGVDLEERVNIERLRNDRLAHVKKALKASELGALLCFDMNNIRYITATHIGTWAMDKLVRFTLLAQDDEPILWDFGSAARHHQIYCPWLGVERSRAGISTLRGATSPSSGLAQDVARKIKRELEKRKLHNEPVGVDVIELPVLFALQAEGIKVVDGQQLMLEVRKIKTQDEITLLNSACMMVDAAYEELYRFMRPGVRENECVGLVSKVLFDLGSEHVEGVNAISGERCSPHPHVYTDRVLRPGDPAFFDLLRGVERDQAAEDRFLPYAEAYAVAVLQGEGRLFIGEAEFLGLRPELDHIRCGDSRFNDADGGIHVVPAAFVGVHHGGGRAADGEGPVVAGAIAVIAVEDIEEGRVAGAQRAVGVDVRMRAAALAGYGVDALDVLRAQIKEDLAHQPHTLVLAHSRPHEAIELLIGGVHHHTGAVEQRDLVLGLDLSCFQHELLAVHHLDPFGLQREEHRQLDNIDPDRLVLQLALLQLDFDFLGDAFRQPGGWVRRAAQGRDAGARALADPRAINLMMSRRRTRRCRSRRRSKI